jgi:hypothetical protein
MTTAPLTTTRTPSLTGALRTVPGAGPDPLEEALALTRRLKLPHIRRVLGDVVPTAKAQRWDPAEVVRVLLAEEAAGRDRANLHTRRKRAAFPTGQTFGDWDETKSSIPAPPRTPSRPSNGSAGARTCPSAGRPGPGSPTSVKPSARPPLRPG